MSIKGYIRLILIALVILFWGISDAICPKLASAEENTGFLGWDIQSRLQSSVTSNGEMMIHSRTIFAVRPGEEKPIWEKFLPTKGLLEWKQAGPLSDSLDGDSTVLFNQWGLLYEIGKSERDVPSNYAIGIKQIDDPISEFGIGLEYCPENISEELKDTVFGFYVTDERHYRIDGESLFDIFGDGNYQLRLRGLLILDDDLKRVIGDYAIELIHPWSPGGDTSLVFGFENIRDVEIVKLGLEWELPI